MAGLRCSQVHHRHLLATGRRIHRSVNGPYRRWLLSRLRQPAS
jgi:hypothetical protein